MSRLRALEPTLAALAQSECNEQQTLRADYINELQTWIEKSAHLQASTDEQLLLAFLRRCRFSLEETKRRIDNYYALRNSFPDVLCNRQVDEALLTQFDRGIHLIPALPIDANGPRLIFSQFSKVDPKASNPREAFKLAFMLFELLALQCDNASIAGLYWIVDAGDCSLEQMLQYDPFLLKKTFMLVEQCLPLRFAEIHVVNMISAGLKVFNFVTSFLPAKLPFKFMLHKTLEDVYEHLPREAMIAEHGGRNGSKEQVLKDWRQQLLAHREYFERDAALGTNEQLRSGQAKAWANAELAGTSGSFRKLEVD
ncbi:CG10300 [Drosophila busckii]|uniref:CG10300 n=1 Tax=Drosophila busckii TaxID=30019 RepID=A0A0M4EHI9_DROBS|nr:alpha-tocopherol transfer protein-like [Drosophila busckii]ALC45846.1 CG10300 [Drosophila busckii]